MDEISRRMSKKKLLEERVSLENDLYWLLQSALFSGGRTEFWMCEQFFFLEGGAYKKKLSEV